MKKLREAGVEILLEPGTRVPGWIRSQCLNVVELTIKDLNGRRVRSLKIYGGFSNFFIGGVVDVMMPGSGNWCRAFAPMKALSIRDLKTGVVQYNYHCCPKCETLTGYKTGAHRPSAVAGREDVSFACTKCGRQWELKSI